MYLFVGFLIVGFFTVIALDIYEKTHRPEAW